MNFNSLNAPKISNKNISNAKIRNSKPDVSSLQASPYEKFEDYEEIDYNILGDINNDGIVTVKDRTSLMNYSNPSFVGPLPNRYDVNKDGKIDNSDIDEINKIISEGDPKKNEIFLHDPEIAKNNRINKINDFAENEYNNISMRILDFDEDNGSKYRKWYDKEFGTNLEVNKSDWCAAFVTYLFAQNDGLNKYIVNSTCADNLVRESIKAGLGTWHEDKSYTDKNNVSTYIPKKGDLILFNPQYNGLYYPYPASANYSQDKDAYVSSHIGYIYDVYIPAEDSDNKSIIIYTIEGNKSNTVSKAEYEIDFSSNEPAVDQRINGYYSPDYNK